jgi:glycosyltransferase involved in cell wall biosynthesis
LVATPLFTVLMPTHQRPDVIGHAIRSVLAQTERSFELLVVGDGAVHGTEEAVGAFSKDPRVKWLDFPKAYGFGYANRNRALRLARGRLIAFAADDDLMLRDHLELMRRQFTDPSVQMAYSQVLWVSTDGIAGPDLTNLLFNDELSYLLAAGNSIAAGGVTYRAGAFANLDVWPETVERSGDLVIWRRLINTHGNGAVRYVRTPTVLHFSARRKNARHSNSGRLAAYIRIAETSRWWPAELKVTIPPGRTEQEVFAEQMAANPVAWTAAIRQAALDCTNRLAMDRLRLLSPE